MATLETLTEDEVMTIRKRLGATFAVDGDFGMVRALRPGQFASAVGRQDAGFGERRKYGTPTGVAATLFYGLVLNHPFENGNKRTALVSMLVLLERNRLWLTETSEEELYEFAKDVADHKFTIVGKQRTPDSEVAGIEAWLRKKSRKAERGDRSMKFQDFKRQMESLGCEFGSPEGNFIKIYREVEGSTRSTKIGYPRPEFTVGVQTVKKVRSHLLFDDAHGIDSGAFYQDLDGLVDEFVNTHRQVLDRLAET